MEIIKTQKNATQYICVKCNFKCCKKSDYNRHLLTAKHKMERMERKIAQKNATPYSCECGKIYKVHSGLWKHKKKCSYLLEPKNVFIQNTNETNTNKDQLIIDLLAQNKELISMLNETIPKIGNTTNNNTTNNNNNQFNLNVFLNEDCKDAINLKDFVKTLKITLQDLEFTKNNGIVEGVSSIIVNNLKGMDVHKRPIHCTDLKRETVYIKNNENWNKSTADEPLMNGLINTIENKHYAVVKHYVQTTPAARELYTPEYNFYAKACVHALGNYEDHDKLNKKIYKKVLPEIKLDKSVI